MTENSSMILKDINITMVKNLESIKLHDKTLEQKPLIEILENLKILLKLSRIKQLRQGLKFYSKGLGGICISTEGIPKNTLVGEYLGEVYPSWYWSLKERVKNNFIVQKNKKNRKSNNLKIEKVDDFYNITLCKKKEESGGLELLMIDPLMKGNYTSRFSHCCSSNCGTKMMIT